MNNIISVFPAYSKETGQFYLLLRDKETGIENRIYYNEESFLNIALGITNLIYEVKRNNYYKGVSK